MNKRFFLRNALTTLAALAALQATAPAAWAASPPTPTAVEGGTVVSVAQAKGLLDGKKARFIDTRSIVNFGKGHIPGAVTASYKEKSDKAANFDAKVDSFDMSKMPADKSTPVVFYSDGPTGWKSYKAAVLAIRAGYSQVSYFRGGFAEWTAQNMPVER